MFHDLDATIATLLRRQLPQDLVQQISITFRTPDAQFPPAGVVTPALDCFLYDINENRELRDVSTAFERQVSGRVLASRALLRVDCSYLITAWAGNGVPAPDQDEHRMLGEVMKVLLLHREIPEQALEGSMKAQAVPIRGTVTPMGQPQSKGEFWQALGGRPRAAIQYTVTISVDPEAPKDVGAIARDVRIDDEGT